MTREQLVIDANKQHFSELKRFTQWLRKRIEKEDLSPSEIIEVLEKSITDIESHIALTEIQEMFQRIK